MAVINYSIQIKETNFSLLSTDQSSTIIVDNNNEVAPSNPAIAYCHNVMPTRQGLNSTELVFTVPAVQSLLDSQNEVIYTNKIVYSTDKNKVTIAFTNINEAFVLDTDTSEWYRLPVLLPEPTGPDDPILIERTYEVTTGTVNGVTYVYLSNIGCYTYSEDNVALEPVTLTGLDASEVLGVVASGGYLVAYTEDSVAWSSTIDPTDFTPSDVTGAGAGKIQEIQGNILFAVPNSTGFLVYTEGNIVSATLTSSVSYPFKFSSVVGSKGGSKLITTSYESSAREQFTYGDAGLQSVTNTEASNILPDITDFISGKMYEDFDDETMTFNYVDLVASTDIIVKAVSFISNRYLVISYGIGIANSDLPTFTYALIYDVELSRLGKVKCTHVDVLELHNKQEAPAKTSIGFLSADGKVEYLDWSPTADSNGVVILGKLQYSRERLITLQGLTVSNIFPVAELDVYDRYVLPNFYEAMVKAYDAASVGNKRIFNILTQAQYHNIIMKGKFNLVDVICKYTIAGRR
tara:strand:+ start:1978 stop:3534 length:1557 start_codon:yes stop_codon:yes gene_type:complete